jgi:hypothetical protein
MPGYELCEVAALSPVIINPGNDPDAVNMIIGKVIA